MSAFDGRNGKKGTNEQRRPQKMRMVNQLNSGHTTLQQGGLPIPSKAKKRKRGPPQPEKKAEKGSLQLKEKTYSWNGTIQRAKEGGTQKIASGTAKGRGCRTWGDREKKRGVGKKRRRGGTDGKKGNVGGNGTAAREKFQRKRTKANPKKGGERNKPDRKQRTHPIFCWVNTTKTKIAGEKKNFHWKQNRNNIE